MTSLILRVTLTIVKANRRWGTVGHGGNVDRGDGFGRNLIIFWRGNETAGYLGGWASDPHVTTLRTIVPWLDGYACNGGGTQ